MEHLFSAAAAARGRLADEVVVVVMPARATLFVVPDLLQVLVNVLVEVSVEAGTALFDDEPSYQYDREETEKAADYTSCDGADVDTVFFGVIDETGGSG